jgi:hypothetical protein
MTKFDKSGKIGLPDLLFRIIRFWQFYGKTNEGAKLKYLKIQGVLRHGKGLKGIKEPRWKKSKQKSRSRKNWTIRFWILEYPVFLQQIESE